MRLLYNIGIRLYGVAIYIAAFFNEKASLWIKGRKEIFEKLKTTLNNSSNKIAWFHCASLGEFEQGRNVIETFRTRFPEYKILLTFFSPSGYEIRKDYKGADTETSSAQVYVFYLPLDTPANAKRFIEIVNPAFAIFVKYEFWFNYLNELKKRNIPVYLISAKFRNDQYFFKRTGSWFLKQLHIYSRIFVQDNNSETLLKSRGFSTVIVSGDTRFDRVVNISKQQVSYPEILSFKGTDMLWICGSTWEEDEKIIFPAFEKLIQSGIQLKLLIAPHDVNPERIKSILNRYPDIIKYSDTANKNLPSGKVILMDKVGLLSFFYRYAEIAYIGGGFGKGIHNLTEAAVYGIPVIFGTNYYKFNEARELIKRGGGFSIANETQLEDIVKKLLNDVTYRKVCGEIASTYITEGAGATEKIISVSKKGFNIIILLAWSLNRRYYQPVGINY